MKNIRDPIYGYIQIYDDEEPVLSRPEIQRLRRVRQLGLTPLVYPGASHSRFEHSLGVLHLAGQFSNSIGLSEYKTQVYRLGGLLHDVGHAPFSHATERLVERDVGVSHEERSCQIIDEMGSILPVPPKEIKSTIRGESKYDIIAGDIDVDRMDYLRRDALKTGVEHGQIDTPTIIQFAKRVDSDIVFEWKSLQAIESLFNARFRMMKSVYFHHTSKIAEAMLDLAVDTFTDETNTDMEEIMKWDDYQLHTNLLSSGGVAQKIYQRISERDLYKRAVYLSDVNASRDTLTQVGENIQNRRRKFEKKIAEEAGVESHHVVLDPPEPPKKYSSNVLIDKGGRINPLSDVSPVSEQVTAAEWKNTIFGVYAPKSDVKNVIKATEKVFGISL